jgi:lipid-binding SYLF domain-containing protein
MRRKKRSHCAGRTVECFARPASTKVDQMKGHSVKNIPTRLILRCALPLALLTSGIAPVSAFAQSTTERRSGPEASASKHVQDSIAVVRRLESDATMQLVMRDARGVFIVPTYGRAAFGVGGQGGAGVLLVRQSGGSWSDPAFYNIGGLSIGAQVGAEGGPVAFVLQNDKAVQRFTDKNNFSLSADAGLTVTNWTRIAQGSTGEGDVVAWSGTRGLFGNVATLSVNDIRFNSRLTQSYYGKAASAADVMGGKVQNADANGLKQALAEAASGAASGKSSGGKGASDN